MIEYSPGTGFFPLWLGIIFAVLSIALFIDATFHCTGKEEESFLPDKAGRKKNILFVASLFLCIALIGKLGFIITCFLYTLFVLVCIEKYSWQKGIISSFCIVFSLYTLFVLALQVPLPKGFWGF